MNCWYLVRPVFQGLRNYLGGLSGLALKVFSDCSVTKLIEMCIVSTEASLEEYKQENNTLLIRNNQTYL